MQNPPAPKEVVSQWLPTFSQAISTGDAVAVASTLLPVGWFRDILTFTWDYRALEGTDKIVAYLSDNLKPGDVSAVELVEDKFCAPTLAHLTGLVEAVFTFETKVARGRGYVRLAHIKATGEWKAASVCMMVADLKGHEESSFELGMYGGHTLAWTDVLRDRKAKVEAEPHVLISKPTYPFILKS